MRQLTGRNLSNGIAVIIANGQPLFVPDTRQDPRFPRLESSPLSWLGIPMLAKGRLTGLIALEKWQPGFYTSEQIQLGAALAGQAAVALENASLYESSVQHAAELDERSQRLALLNRFSASLGGLLDANQVLSLTAEEKRHAFEAERAAGVSLLSGQPTWILSSPAAKRRLPLLLPDVPLISRLKEALGIFVAENADAEPELAPLVELVGKGSKAVLAIPLAIGRELVAVLFIMNPAAGTFASAEME